MKSLFLISAQCLWITSIAQITPASIKKSLENFPDGYNFYNRNYVSAFYATNNFHPAWYKPGGEHLRNELFQLIDSSEKIALKPSDYHITELKNKVKTTTEDSVLRDLRMTDAAIHFLHDLSYGNRPPVVAFRGIEYQPDVSFIIKYLSIHCRIGMLEGLVEKIEPCTPEYFKTKKA